MDVSVIQENIMANPVCAPWAPVRARCGVAQCEDERGVEVVEVRIHLMYGWSTLHSDLCADAEVKPTADLHSTTPVAPLAGS